MRNGYQWFDSTFYTPVFKFLPSGGPSLHLGSYAQRGFISVSLAVVRLWVSTSKIIYCLNVLDLLVTILSELRVGLSSYRRPVLGSIDYRHCHQLFLHLRLKSVIKLSYMVFLSSVHSKQDK